MAWSMLSLIKKTHSPRLNGATVIVGAGVSDDGVGTEEETRLLEGEVVVTGLRVLDRLVVLHGDLGLVDTVELVASLRIP
jgi:hypothetical protein